MKKVLKKVLGERMSKKLGIRWRNVKQVISFYYLLPFEKKYLYLYLPQRVNKIRRKDRVKVAFVIHELGSWKTEELYKRMLSHDRFDPILLVADSIESAYSKPVVISYLEEKKYSFHILDPRKNICSQYHPDIIFYQKPYLGILPPKLMFNKNLDALFCYTYYSFRNKKLKHSQNALIHRYIWQEYVENSVVKEELTSLMDNKASNIFVTGLPVMDELMREKDYFDNPWRKISGFKKKIIYAPHHSIVSGVGLWSTFLMYGDFMLEMADKYSDRVQWAFKPHPLLYPKLCKMWGKEKTEKYYEKWKSMNNCQFEDGPYIGLFKHSDAMIHDCGSFMLEYHYTHNPVMYLMCETQAESPINQQTIEAKNAHYKAWSKEDIESFIINVINNVDPMEEERRKFFNKFLLPPNNSLACDNIINLILGR